VAMKFEGTKAELLEHLRELERGHRDNAREMAKVKAATAAAKEWGLAAGLAAAIHVVGNWTEPEPEVATAGRPTTTRPSYDTARLDGAPAQP
jgi:hypothetical protein